MSKSDVYAQNAVPATRQPQIAGFTAQAMRQTYAAQIRDLRALVGADDTPIVLRDPVVLNAIASAAGEQATRIVDEHNARLQSALDKMPDGLTSDEYNGLLDEFRSDVMAYNKNTLIPYQMRTTTQQATLDFVDNNGLVTTWTIDPMESTSPPSERCQQAIDIVRAAGDMGVPLTAFDDIPPRPFRGTDHQNCPHLVIPAMIDDTSVKEIGTLWDGTQPSIDAQNADAMDAGVLGKGHMSWAGGLGLQFKVHDVSDEARNPHGEWTSGGGTALSPALDLPSSPITTFPAFRTGVVAYADALRTAVGEQRGPLILEMQNAFHNPASSARGVQLFSGLMAAARQRGFMVIDGKLGPTTAGITLPDGSIELNEDMVKTSDFAAVTLAHELSHADGNTNKDARQKPLLEELTAGLTSALVAGRAGVDASPNVYPYFLAQAAVALGRDTVPSSEEVVGLVDAVSPVAAQRMWDIEAAMPKQTKSAVIGSAPSSRGPAIEVTKQDDGSIRIRMIGAYCGNAPISESKSWAKGLGLHAKFNPNHDERGRFTSADYGAGLTARDDPSQAVEHRATMDYATMMASHLGETNTWKDKLPSSNGASKAKNFLYSQPDITGATISAIEAASKGAVSRDDIATFDNTWNASASIHESVAVSEAAREMIGQPRTPYGQDLLDKKLRTTDEWPEKMAKATAFVDAQYKVTQDAFARLGYKPADTIDLYRGFGRPYGEGLRGVDESGWSNATIQTRGASSWSSSPSRARMFSSAESYDHGYVIHSQVPVKDILSTGFTGLGVPAEQEFVVLGGPRPGRAIAFATKNDASFYTDGVKQKFNQNHDPKTGEFASMGGEKEYVRMVAKGLQLNDPLSDPRAENFTTVHDLAYHSDLLNARRIASQAVADHSNTLTTAEVQPLLGDWVNEPGGENWAILQSAAHDVYNLPLSSAEGRVAAHYPETWFPSAVDAAKETVLASERATHEALQKEGLSGLTVYRGVGYIPGEEPSAYSAANGAGKEVDAVIQQKPLSSWSISASEASNFALETDLGVNPRIDGGGADYRPYLLTAHIPADRVVALPHTGFALVDEGEVVIKGGPTTVHIKNLVEDEDE